MTIENNFQIKHWDENQNRWSYLFPYTKDLVVKMSDGKYLADRIIAGQKISDGDITISTSNVEGLDTLINEKPNPPANCSIRNQSDGIELSFEKPNEKVKKIDNYEVWVSADGTSYDLISFILEDGSPRYSILDMTFDTNDTFHYKIYSVSGGVRSPAVDLQSTFNKTLEEAKNLKVLTREDYFLISYDTPNDRFFDHFEIYHQAHASTSSLDESSATIVYSGKNTQFIYEIPEAEYELYHQFWIKTVGRDA